METQQKTILILATQPLSQEALNGAVTKYSRDSVKVLCFDDYTQNNQFPDSWSSVKASDFLNHDQLRQDFLSFLDTWPRQKFANGKTFDQMFQYPQGYSVWWIGPGSRRHIENKVFIKLRALWICAKAIEHISPEKVLIFTKDNDLASLLVSKCQKTGTEYEFMPSSAKPAPAAVSTSLFWLLKSLAELVLLPWLLLTRAILARILAGSPQKSTVNREEPAIVLTGTFPRHVKLEDNHPVNWYWANLTNALEKSNSGIRRIYMFYTSSIALGRFKRFCWLYHSGWVLLRKMTNIAPLEQRYVCWSTLIRLIPLQISSLLKYYCLERKQQFRNSYIFAGVDVSRLYIPITRQAVAHIALWQSSVEAICKSLQAIGNVKVVLICEEMYKVGIRYIAAAKKLGIPTIGVQHGAIFPMHITYTLPPGQIEGAPTCDYFAAYGDYAKEVLSTYGSYPADRIWIVGGPRFDHLVNNPPDRIRARTKLGIDQRKKLILLANQSFPWFQQVFEVILEITHNRGDTIFWIKMHPQDKIPPRYHHLIKDTNAKNVSFYRENLDDLIAACDVLISGPSTTILEAILINRKTICVNFSGEPDLYPYSQEGPSLHAKSKLELTEVLESVFQMSQKVYEQKRHDFLQRHLGPTINGQASDTFAEKIIELISRF